MPQTIFWNLLAKKLAAEATAEELKELAELMRQHPDWLYAAQYIQDLWNIQKQDDKSTSAEEAFQKHLSFLKENGVELNPLEAETVFLHPYVKKKRKKWLIPAVALLIIISLSTFLLFRSSEVNPTSVSQHISEVTTKAGSRSKLVLPDSSIVWLNAGSKLTYNSEFGLKKREINLNGEAYFDVKRSKIPFIIKTDAIQIKVLGTAFNIKSYSDEKTTETSLVRGEVEITVNKRPGEKFILKPNEKLVIAHDINETRKIVTEQKAPLIVLSKLTQLEDNSILETSWVNNKLVFRDESFEDLAKKMERWYNVKVEIKDPEIGQIRLGGTFENETVVQALEALQITTGFHFEINSNQITITK